MKAMSFADMVNRLQVGEECRLWVRPDAHYFLMCSHTGEGRHLTIDEIIDIRENCPELLTNAPELPYDEDE